MARVGKKLSRGDPGFLGSLLKVGTGLVKTFVPGAAQASSAISTVSRAVGLTGGKRPSLAQAKMQARSRSVGRRAPVPPRTQPPGMIYTPPASFGPQLPAVLDTGSAASRPTVQDGTSVQRDDLPVAGCPAGMRPNKSAYFWTSPGGTLIFQPPGTKCVRIRRRNPLNPRAFDRAFSRVASAKRFGEKLGRVTIRKKCTCK